MLNSIVLNEQNDVDGGHRVSQNLVRNSLHIAANTAADRRDARGRG